MNCDEPRVVSKKNISFRNTTLPFKGWTDGSAVVTLSMHPVTMRIYILVAILRRQDSNIVSGLSIGSRLRRLILLGLVSYRLADCYQFSTVKHVCE